MFVYSKKIIQFVHDIKQVIREVLTQEVGLKVTGARFYDRLQRTSYPISVVVYNNKAMLGYFDAEFYELGFHEQLMHTNRKQLNDIIRHEIAHYMTYINYGHVQMHGAEFRAVCKRLGWDEEVYRATTCLDDGEMPGVEEGAVLRKVKKLMALATSNDKNEAEAAMIKSQQLLLKHNIEAKFEEPDEERIFVKRIMQQKKETAKMRAIATILKTFFVSIVYRRSDGFTYLEILGNGVNVEIADYVAGFLDGEFDKLWAQTHLKGTIAKNSFFLGIAKGYCNKIAALKKEYTGEVTNALMVLEKQLVEQQAMVYPRLSTNRSYAQTCQESSRLGEKMGRQLQINPAINRSNREVLKLK